MTVEIREHMGEWRQVSEQEARLYVRSNFFRYAKTIEDVEHTIGGRFLSGCTVRQLFEGHEDELPVRMRGGPSHKQSALDIFQEE